MLIVLIILWPKARLLWRSHMQAGVLSNLLLGGRLVAACLGPMSCGNPGYYISLVKQGLGV